MHYPQEPWIGVLDLGYDSSRMGLFDFGSPERVPGMIQSMLADYTEDCPES